MTNENPCPSPRPDCQDVELVAEIDSIRFVLPAPRRDEASREALVHRIRSEFYAMPGLSLTLMQASHLFGIPLQVCSRVFTRLVDEGLLELTSDARFGLRIQPREDHQRAG